MVARSASPDRAAQTRPDRLARLSYPQAGHPTPRFATFCRYGSNVSTPPFLDLPTCARPARLRTARGDYFAAHISEIGEPMLTALLVPGYTGSKEDFIAILEPLARRGVRVIAMDPRGQFETPGPDEPDAYRARSQGADVAAVIDALDAGPVHLVGHSFGGLICREAAIARTDVVRSLTLLSSGPAALAGPAAERVRLQLAALQEHDLPSVQLMREAYAQAEDEPPPPEPILEFMRRRFTAHSRAGLIAVSSELLAAADRVAVLSDRLGDVPALVAYGDKDDAWPPDQQRDMAVRLGAERAVIDGAGHSPAVDAPVETAAALARFWFRRGGARS